MTSTGISFYFPAPNFEALLIAQNANAMQIELDNEWNIGIMNYMG